jgi:hypothetical protein
MNQPLRPLLQTHKDKRDAPDLYPYPRLDTGAEVGIVALCLGVNAPDIFRSNRGQKSEW